MLFREHGCDLVQVCGGWFFLGVCAIGAAAVGVAHANKLLS